MHYRRKNTAIFWFYRFRQSRYRQKRENRQPPKNYCRMAIPPRLCPPKKPLPTTTLKKMYNLFFLSRCHIISTTSFLPVGNTPYRKPQNTRTICTTPLKSTLEAGLHSRHIILSNGQNRVHPEARWPKPGTPFHASPRAPFYWPTPAQTRLWPNFERVHPVLATHPPMGYPISITPTRLWPGYLYARHIFKSEKNTSA